jgi:hypothetical protein
MDSTAYKVNGSVFQAVGLLDEAGEPRTLRDYVWRGC